MHHDTPRRLRLLLSLLVGLSLLGVRLAGAEEEDEIYQPPLSVAAAGAISDATALSPAAQAVVNFGELARQESRAAKAAPAVRGTWAPPEHEGPPEPYFPPAPSFSGKPGLPLAVPSPSPTTSFMGLDDIPMADSLYIVIPPDVGGAVGPTMVLCDFNNNYQILNKSTGAVVATLGTATFWAPVVAAGERLNLTDPRSAYDPYNDCWIVAMQTYTTGAGKLLIGVSQTNDPTGSWYLYSFNTAVTIDFPILGFNKNWISLSVNRYSIAGAFQRGINLVVDYPQARAGTGTGTLFTHAANTHFCSSPCVTYSASEDTLFVVTHLSSAGATYAMDTITGTPGTPTYTSGGSQVRTGGGWVQPGGNQLPQSAPNSGASACGATPCKLENQDSQVRSAPTYRGGYIYYAQTVGLPSGGLTHTAAQWTKLSAISGAYSDGGRIDDPTATATNGGKWYAYTHIAVNSEGSFLVGYSQFSSAQHPSAGYSVHVAGDAAGTVRDPQIYHAGEDYYHKTFSTATGRNRWGDFSTAQVDPSDDLTLWTLQEYAKTRTGTDDGNTGSNSSRWSSWWAGVTVSTNHTITASAGAGGSISPSGAVAVADGADQAFTITPDTCFVVADVLVDGGSVGAVTDYTFTNVTADHTISASFTAAPGYTITASAGAGGSITPSGAVGVACGADQAFTITPDSCHVVADVLVDGGSVGAVTDYTFLDVQADHTISASFAAINYTITASAGAGGSITPSGAVGVTCGDDQAFTITPDTCYVVEAVLVDGDTVGAVTDYTFLDVQADHTITASFAPSPAYTITATAGAGGSIVPSGAVVVACGDDQAFTITPDSGFNVLDVLVDAGSVGAVLNYTFLDVMADHTIDASFVDVECPSITVTAPNGGESVIIGSDLDITWTASDNVAVTCLDVLLSRNGSGGPFVTLSSCVPDTGGYTWTVTGPVTTDALVKVIAHDAAGNACEDVSDTTFAIGDVTGVAEAPVTAFALRGIQPNPTRGSARVEFSVPTEAHVLITVFDMQGRAVATLADRTFAPGYHDVTWNGAGDGSRLAAGIYLIRLQAPGTNQVQRVTLIH